VYCYLCVSDCYLHH